MADARTKLVVLGGSGFLGREVCRLARSMGHEVVSISRGGRPEVDERWVEGIRWVSADVFEPEAWCDELSGAEAMIVCLGVMDEAGSGEAERKAQERAADTVARCAEDADIDAVVYISAKSAPSDVQPFLQGKRQAEAALADHPFKLAVLRPALLLGSDRPDSVIEGALVDLIGQTPGGRSWADERRGLRREIVAICALRAALEPDIEGLLEIDDIAHLGDAMFIQ